ncbi:MAG: DUF3540 domain-containing protein [Polyangiaceae bacterium]
MTNLAKKLSPPVPAIETTATVLRVEGSCVVLSSADRELRAARATSCLVAPIEGDYVLVATDGYGESYVLAILRRADDAKVTLAAEGDLELTAPSGKVAIVSRDGVDLVTGGDVGVAARAVSMRARIGSVVFERLSYIGDVVRAEVSKTRLEGGVVERFVDRVSETVKRSFRRVEELDQVKAKRIDYGAEQSLALHSENTVVAAKELVKVDGAQIHVG